MNLNATLARVTERIRSRSAQSRATYLARMDAAASGGSARSRVSCANQAHAYAAFEPMTSSFCVRRASPTSASSPPTTTCSPPISRSSTCRR